MPGSDSTKPCSKCGEEKYLGEFHVRKAATCGRAARCKSCTVADKVEYRQNQVTSDSEYGARYRKVKPEKEKVRKRKYYANNPEKIKAYRETYKTEHPEKIQARLEATRAIRSGILVRPDTCAQCGARGGIQGHHPDYTKPLFIEWLCRMCHGRVHSGR